MTFHFYYSYFSKIIFFLFLDTVYQTAEYFDYIIIQHNLKIRDTINIIVNSFLLSMVTNLNRIKVHHIHLKLD